MIYQSISAADFLSDEEIEETRFLAALKGLIREELASRSTEDDVGSQAKLAARCGMDPAQLSRALSPDHHVSTKTLFRIAYALDRRLLVSFARRVRVGPTNWAPLPVTTTAQQPTPAHREIATTADIAPLNSRRDTDRSLKTILVNA